jgi:O-antigen/teichoic acid export membrane protein
VAVVYAGLVLANLGSMVHLFLWHPELRPRELPESLASLKEMGESGILFFVLGLTGNLSYMLDNVLALQLLGAQASASMTIAMRICTTSIGMLYVLSQPLWPAFTDAAHKSDRPWIRRTLLRGTALLTGAAVAGSAVLILFGEKLLRLWLGADLVGGALLWAISAWVVAQALVSVSNLLLNGLLLIRFQIAVFSIATAIAFMLKFLLAPHLGVAGILWGTSVVVPLVVFPAGVWRIYRWADHAATQERMPDPQSATG